MKAYFPDTKTWEDPYSRMDPADYRPRLYPWMQKLICLIILFVAGCFYFSWQDSKPPKPPSPEHVKAVMVVAARDYIRATLLAPASADFEWNPKVIAAYEDHYKVYTFVDAQNFFGAKLRKYYVCEVGYFESSDSGEVLSCNTF